MSLEANSFFFKRNYFHVYLEQRAQFMGQALIAVSLTSVGTPEFP